MNTTGQSSEEDYFPLKEITNLSIPEIIDRINTFSVRELQLLKHYEKAHSNRRTLIEAIEFRLRIFRENGRF